MAPIRRGIAVLDLWIRIGRHCTKAGLRKFSCVSERENENRSTPVSSAFSSEGR
jgi:hypothetical protein